MVVGSGGIQGIVWGYDREVIGGDLESFRWSGIGVFNLCGSVKKRNPQKTRREALEGGDMEAVGCDTA